MNPTVIIPGPHAFDHMSLEDAMSRLGARRDEPMSEHTTVHIGGPADWFLEAENVEEVTAARIVARSREIPVVIIGNGSNFLVSDKGIRGLVIKPAASLATTVDYGPGKLRVGAGVKIPELARTYRERNAGGIEWGFGVPGCVGGGIFMNAGTRDGEMKDIIERVMIIGRGGQLNEITNEECDFAYRSSRFQRTGECIVGAIVHFTDAPYDAVKAKRALEDRKRTQPLNLPNFGSVFTNPPGDYAARLIEEAGLKGRSIGGAQFSSLHANFIVNHGGARAGEVKALMDLAVAEVRKKFGVELHSEVRMMGEI